MSYSTWQADQLRGEVGRMRLLAEQAERERDEKADLLETALSQRIAAERERDEALIAVERVEAGNAALLRLLEEVLINVDSIQERRRYGEMAPELAVDVIREDLERHSRHGAALLERMRALESFRDELTEALKRWGHAEDCPVGDEDVADDACECVNGEVRTMLKRVTP